MTITSLGAGSTDLNSAASQPDAPLRAKAEEAAEKFEAFFINEMLRQMRRSAREIGGEGGMLQDRAARDMLEMADGLTADALAGQRAFGIADMLLRQILPEAEAVPAEKLAKR